jgi:hypothetical protein
MNIKWIYVLASMIIALNSSALAETPVATSHPITDDDVNDSSEFQPELTIHNPSLENYNRCMNASIRQDGVSAEGNRVVHRCWGDVAEQWFNDLADRPTKTIHGRTGTFVVRDFGGGTCGKQTIEADGRSPGANPFVCEIYQRGPN